MPAICTTRLPSDLLDRPVQYTALLPDSHRLGLGPYPVLYILHPLGGDHADWVVRTRLEQHLHNLRAVVVLPSLDRSLACNTADGAPYETIFIDELMAHVEATYSVAGGRGQTALLGAGTGGFAALRLALTYPYWFGAAASHSAPVYLAQEEKMSGVPGWADKVTRYRQIFGDAEDPRRRAYDLVPLVESIPADRAPALYLDCGGDDPLLPQNRDFHRRLNTLRIRHTFVEAPGKHSWDFWERRLPESIGFIAQSLGWLPSDSGEIDAA